MRGDAHLDSTSEATLDAPREAVREAVWEAVHEASREAAFDVPTKSAGKLLLKDRRPTCARCCPSDRTGTGGGAVGTSAGLCFCGDTPSICMPGTLEKARETVSNIPS